MTLEEAKLEALHLSKITKLNFHVVRFRHRFDVVSDAYFERYGNIKSYFSTNDTEG